MFSLSVECHTKTRNRRTTSISSPPALKRGNRFTEIPDELKREISSAILTWARYLEKLRKLKLDEDIKLDQDYINSEILLLDSDIKKKIADLAYLINHEENTNSVVSIS